MRRRLVMMTSGLALLLTMPAAAQAVTGTIDKQCYGHIPTKGSEPITVALTGGTPGAPFLVAATVPGKGTGSAGSASGTFDAAGNGTAQITDVSPPSGTIGPTKGQPIAISAQDFGAGGVDTPIAQTLVTNVSLSVASRPTSARRARQVSVSGTPFAGQKMYGFVVKGTSRHVLSRFSLGTANVCGFVSSKHVVAPEPFRDGKFRLYVNAGPKLDKPHAVWSTFSINRRYL